MALDWNKIWTTLLIISALRILSHLYSLLYCFLNTTLHVHMLDNLHTSESLSKVAILGRALDRGAASLNLAFANALHARTLRFLAL